MNEIDRLVAGYKRFHQKYFVEDGDVYRKLADGQSPSVAMIACSDSRVDPSILTGAEPGELFVVRNVANLVPPYQPDFNTYHGTSAALEFAVTGLGVSHIIVLGHSKCGGIRALMEQPEIPETQSFVQSWMGIAADVKKDILHHHAHLEMDVKAHLCERKGIERSLANLSTFPWISERQAKNTLKLHGWHFDLDQGLISEYQTGGNWVVLD